MSTSDSGASAVRDVREHLVFNGQWWGRTVWPVSPPDEWSRGLHDRVAEMMTMAMCEAGYPLTPVFDDRLGVHVPGPGWRTDDTDERMLDKARLLVYPALGIEFTVGEAPVWAVA